MVVLGAGSLLALALLVAGVFYSWSASLMHQSAAGGGTGPNAPATLRSVVVYCMDHSLGIALFRVDTTRAGAAGWGSFAPGFRRQTWWARSAPGRSYRVADHYSGVADWAWRGFTLRSTSDAVTREVQVGVPTWLVPLLCGAAAWRSWVVWRRSGRSDAHACPNCGYDRRGAPTGTCPECGTRAGAGKHPRASPLDRPGPNPLH